MVGWHCLNIKPKDTEKKQFSSDLITLASKDVFIKLLPNTNIIKTLDKSSKIVMWIVWNLYDVSLATFQFSSLAKHLTFKKFCWITKINVCCQTFFRQCKKTYTQTWKCPFLRSFKTLVQISTSTEVNHLTSKKLNIRRKMDSSLFRKFWLH